tara:strand:- start:2400 stop:2810 length:411 start_codon:yes stop_codon:yes gene_type:complete
MELKLTYYIRPIAHQSVRMSKKGYTYTPKNVVKYKRSIAEQTKSQLPEDFVIIKHSTPITVEYLHYIYKYPAKWRKKDKENFTFRISSPDLLDNVNKAFMDALEGIVFENDASVCYVKELKKYYGDEYKIELKLLY